ncbi:MAG: hypothetical protein Q7U05_06940 [Polaromonas sp.]|nr:hypothetical protein [Polaromonas sp.]
MKTIFQNPGHIAATKLLGQLSQAHADASAQETALLVKLSDQTLQEKPSALSLAKSFMTGQTAPAEDVATLNRELATIRSKKAVLLQAIDEQRHAIKAVVSSQSAIVNAEAKQSHIDRVEGIQTELKALHKAQQAEHQLRAEIEAAGFTCSLEAMTDYEMNFTDTESAVTRFAKRVSEYLVFNEIASAKSVNVRMLSGADVGDVLSVAGAEAAARLRAGHAELTKDKATRTTRPDGAVRGQSLATAFGA